MSSRYPDRYPVLSVFVALLFFFLSLPFSELFAQPIVSDVTPSKGPIGTRVVIRGRNFDAKPLNNVVYFGAVRATVIGCSDTAVAVTVPAGATYQPISVTTGRRTAYFSKPFLVEAVTALPALTTTSFAADQRMPVGAYPNFVLSGDLTGDGKIDLLNLNQNAGTLSIHQNRSDRGLLTFAPAINYPAGTTPFGAALGDLDGDGRLDVAIGNYAQHSIIVYRNTTVQGNLSLGDKIELGSGQNPISVGIIDFDLDG